MTERDLEVWIMMYCPGLVFLFCDICKERISLWSLHAMHNQNFASEVALDLWHTITMGGSLWQCMYKLCGLTGREHICHNICHLQYWQTVKITQTNLPRTSLAASLSLPSQRGASNWPYTCTSAEWTVLLDWALDVCFCSCISDSVVGSALPPVLSAASAAWPIMTVACVKLGFDHPHFYGWSLNFGTPTSLYLL